MLSQHNCGTIPRENHKLNHWFHSITTFSFRRISFGILSTPTDLSSFDVIIASFISSTLLSHLAPCLQTFCHFHWCQGLEILLPFLHSIVLDLLIVIYQLPKCLKRTTVNICYAIVLLKKSLLSCEPFQYFRKTLSILCCSLYGHKRLISFQNSFGFSVFRIFTLFLIAALNCRSA